MNATFRGALAAIQAESAKQGTRAGDAYRESFRTALIVNRALLGTPNHAAPTAPREGFTHRCGRHCACPRTHEENR